MIKLNRFHHFDTDHLCDYLHDESLKGNHLIYMSNTILLFKKGQPQSVYYNIVPDDMRVIEAMTTKTVASMPMYKIYKNSEPFIIPMVKRNVLLQSTVAIILALVGLGALISIDDSSLFYLANNFILLFISLIIFLLCVEIPFRLYQSKVKKRIKPLLENGTEQLKNILDFISHYYHIIGALVVLIVSFGLSWNLFWIMLIITLSCILPLKIRDIAMCLLPAVMMWSFAVPVYDPGPIELLQPETVTYQQHVYTSTIFVPTYEFYSGISLSGGSNSLSFLYYEASLKGVFTQIKDFVAKTKLYGFDGLEKTFEVDGFILCGSYENGKYHYFETETQLLFIQYYGNFETIVTFAKMRMGV